MTSTNTDFVHLNLHSDYSLKDGMVRIDQLMSECAERGFWAVGLTDRMNLFGLMKFYKSALAAGIKPICGIDAQISESSGNYWVTLMMRNYQGYIELSKLLTKAYDGTFDYGCIDAKGLHEASENLLILMGKDSNLDRIMRLKNPQEQAHHMNSLKEIWGDRCYIKVCRSGDSDEEQFNAAALNLASQYDLALIADARVRFLNREDFDIHEARVCIAQNRRLDDLSRERLYEPSQYFQSREEMALLFADLPEALENSVEIAKRCTFELKLGAFHLPVVDSETSMEETLRQQAEAGLKKRLPNLDEAQLKPYLERLDRELSVIQKMGFPGYFLVVADFVNWARNNDIPVGPGRGSGVSSVVAWALQITEIDPLEFNLLFERFLNPDRISLPDFDIDICMWGRDKVIRYVENLYGTDKVAQVVTFSRLKARQAVRDAARVLGKPMFMQDNLAGCIPNDPQEGVELLGALENSEELKTLINSEADYQEIWTLALKLEGLIRGVGKHAAGVVIAPKAVDEFTPLYSAEKDDHLVTQSDKNDLEEMGLVKFDFLGLNNLTMIQLALNSINNAHKSAKTEPLQASSIPLDDAKTYKLLGAGDTMGVFQLESSGVQDLLQRLKPTEFNDVVVIMALYRPGALGMKMHLKYADRKNDKEEVEYPDAALEEILSETYGIFVYQEQVMQGAQIMGNFTPAEADSLRRAMGKKDHALMAKMGGKFLTQAQELGHSKDTAEKLFELWEQFSQYGFNKSHAVAYGLISYQTAWLKTNYPEHFIAAAMSCNTDRRDVIQRFYHDCLKRSIKVLPPCVNTSKSKFEAPKKGEITYGLSAISGLGKKMAEELCNERNENGPYQGLYDLCNRLYRFKIQKRAVALLINCGALDCFSGWNRASLLHALDTVWQAVDQDQNVTEQDMLGGGAAEVSNLDSYHRPEFHLLDKLGRLYSALGFYIEGEHPISIYQDVLKNIGFSEYSEVKKANKNEHKHLAGVITEIRPISIRGQHQSTSLEITMDNGGELIQVITSEADMQKQLRSWKKGALIAVQLTCDRHKVITHASLLEDFVARRVRRVELHIDNLEDLGWMAEVKQFDVAKDDKGSLQCVVVLSGENTPTVEFLLPNIKLTYALSKEFKNKLSSHKVVLVYDK